MGANMVRRLVRDNHEVVAYDVLHQTALDLQNEIVGVTAVQDFSALISNLPAPKVIWLMVPHKFVDETIDELLAAGLTAGDIVIDGGNSNFNLTKERGVRLLGKGIHFVDSGTSGGVWGA